MPTPRFFLLLALGLLLLCAAYPAAVLAGASLADIQALDRITQHLSWHIRPVQAAELRGTVVGLGLLAGLAGLGLLLCLRPAAGRHEARQLSREVRGACAGLGRAFGRLQPGQQRWLGLLLGVLTLVRLYFSLNKPLHGEEVASYEFFVRPGLLATSAYYPVPNNHILSNTLSYGFYLLSSDFWWCMRLPVWLLSTVGSLLLFALLQRRTGFWVAAGATLLFSWLQLSLYLASTGRGYWLLIALAALHFFSALELLRAHSAWRRAAWAGLLLSGMLGMYTIPTFAYLLASVFSGMALALAAQKRWRELGHTVAVGLLLAVGTVLLYVPLLLVSGLPVLVGNGFVAPRPPAEFWQGVLACTWYNEGFLAGQRSLGALLVLPVLAATAWLLWRRPAAAGPQLRQLGSAALWCIVAPYALVLAQRVFPPERVLLYKAFFFFLLLALLARWWLSRPRPTAQARAWRGALWGAGLLFASYQTYTVERYSRNSKISIGYFETAFRWLAAQPAGAVLAPPPLHHLLFRFYGHQLTPGRAWQLDDRPRAARAYRYLVTAPTDGPPLAGYRDVYHNPGVVIYAPAPAYPQTQP